MNRNRRLSIAASLAAVAAVAVTAFAPAASAGGRRPHCAAIPTGTPGTFVVVCSTARA